MDYDFAQGGWSFMSKINFDSYSPVHKTGHTSKGDQRKWKIGDIWYKADYMGYESLSEILISHLLQKSKLKHPFVLYEPVQIEYNGSQLRGCSSKNFLEENQILIPLEKLYRQYEGTSLAIKLSEFSDVSEKIQYLVNQIETITHLEKFGEYITAILEIDAFFLNEDRHTNNIAVVYNEKSQEYALSPFFDQGLCLFADTTQDYPLDLSIEECLDKIKAKPFASDFDEQLDAAEELYGTQIKFDFSIHDIKEELGAISCDYSDEICNRVEGLLRLQLRKYKYLTAKNFSSL